ncbi:MAG: outer membrane lipoprotein carrier protein LolA, partial [Cytophagales bacterium]
SAIVRVHAQYDEKAEKILSEVAKKYQELKTFKANFSYTLESPTSGVNENFKGDILVKGSKFILKLGSQEIINNGTTQWTYLKDENEVNISDYTPEDDDINPSKIYTIYKKGFKYMMNDEANENKALYDVVDLIPEDKSKQVFKIRIVILKKDRSVKSWKLFEKNGNRYTYSVTNFTPNVEVEDKSFTFDKTKYKGITVVDLR